MSIPFGKLIRMVQPHRRGDVYAMLFKLYIDESADQPETFFTVGGFIGREDQWTALDSEWRSALPRGISYSHATDCFGGRKQFEGMSIAERMALLSTLTDLIVRKEIQLVSAGVDVNAYASFAPKLKDNEFGGNKYVAPFSFVVELACKDYMNLGQVFPRESDDSCALFIEDGMWEPTTRIALKSIKEFKEDRWWRDRIGTDTYGRKGAEQFGTADVIPLLQVADLGAFLACKVLTNAPPGPIPWKPYYERLYRAGRVFRSPMPITHDNLKVFYAIYQWSLLSEEERDATWEQVAGEINGAKTETKPPSAKIQ